jgi:hypothetical protein
MPLSTTSQRTFRDRQQEHALEARRLTVLPLVGRPAIETFLFACGGMVESTAAAIRLCKLGNVTSYKLECIDSKEKKGSRDKSGKIGEEEDRGATEFGINAQGPGGVI